MPLTFRFISAIIIAVLEFRATLKAFPQPEKSHRKARPAAGATFQKLGRVGSTMANIKSQKKRNKQNEARRLRNRLVRGPMRSALAKARVAVAQSSEDAEALVFNAVRALDRAVQKGVLHKNNVARKKSRLVKKLAAKA